MPHREPGMTEISSSEAILFAASESTRHKFTEMRELEDEGDPEAWLRWQPPVKAQAEMAQDGVIE